MESSQIIRAAEALLGAQGISQSGMDRIAAAAKVSTRTLYKHVGSRDALFRAVLSARHQRFFGQMRATSIAALFDELEAWIAAEGAHGCLFLQLEREVGAPVAAEVDAYRQALRARLAELAAQEVPPAAVPSVTQRLLVLFEGATASATYCGTAAVAAAREMAADVLARG